MITNNCSCFVHGRALPYDHEPFICLETPAGACALDAGGRVGNRRRPRSPPRPRHGVERLGRYEPSARIAFDDGWQGSDELPPFATSVTVDATQRSLPATIRRTSPLIARSIRIAAASTAASIVSRGRRMPISGCRRTRFESKLFMKPNAPELLERELSAPGYVPKIMAIGTNTDPYQPIERRFKIMRGILEVLERAGHPVGIVTKSALVLRDLDILARMAEHNLVKVALSVTSLDAKLARTMEPRASTPPRRLETLRQLVKAGVPASVMVAPIIPALNDAEIERILDAVAAAGVRNAGYVLLRLPLEVRDRFANGSSRIIPTAIVTSSSWCATPAAARITIRHGASGRPVPARSPG